MKEKSHKGQKHKGCSMCKYYKQVGNGKDRHPPRDLRQLNYIWSPWA